MSRKRNTRPVKKWTLHIDRELAERVEAQLIDTITGKVITGSRQRLIEALLSETLNSIEAGNCAFDPISGQLYRKAKVNP